MYIIIQYKHNYILGKFLLSATSNYQDCSKSSTLHSLDDLFSQPPSCLLWEESSHVAVNA